MSSSVVSSSLFPAAPLVPCHGKSSSDIADHQRSINDVESSVRQCLSARISNNSCDDEPKLPQQSPQPSQQQHCHAATAMDQPIDLTTPSTGTIAPCSKNDAEAIAASVGSSPASLVDERSSDLSAEVLRRQKQKALVDAVLFNHSAETPPPHQDAPTKPNHFSDVEDNMNGSSGTVEDDGTAEMARSVTVASNNVRSSASKRKSDHPIKHDNQQPAFEPSSAKIPRNDHALSLAGLEDARQFIRVASCSLKEHLSTTTNRLVEDVMNQIEAYFCVAPQNAPPGSKLSKGCQTDMPILSALYPGAITQSQQQQLQNLASTYGDLLASAAAGSASSVNQAASLINAATNGNNTRNAPSPPSLLSSMAQFGGISTLYSPVSPPQHQQAMAMALAASANNNRVNGGANAIGTMAGLLPTPAPFGGSGASYHGVYNNPFLANVFQSAAQALFQQQQQQSQQPQQKAAAFNNAASALFNNLNAAASGNSKKFSTSSLLGQTSSAASAAPTPSNQRQHVASPSPSPFIAGTGSSTVVSNNNNPSSSTSALDFSSVANFMAVQAAKRKRTKVTDTRLSARTARKLLDNSFQGGIGACDGDDQILLNVDGATPEKQSRSEHHSSEGRSSFRQGIDGPQLRDDDEALLIKADVEDFENDERILLGNQDDIVCADQDDAEIAAENLARNGDESPSLTDVNAGGASSTSSRVSVVAGDVADDVGDNSSSHHIASSSINQVGSHSSSLLLPFTPNRSHHHHHHHGQNNQQQQHLDPAFLAEQTAMLQQNGLAQLAGTAFPLGKTSTLTSMHLRKAKLMFFYVRYPSSSVLKIYFPDVSFNKNNTAQLVKWFSNFREFYYINIEKYARQLVAEGVTNCEDVDVNRNSELFKVLNLHYNRNNQLQVPPGFSIAVRTTVREFMRAILLQKDQDPSWKKQIYKVIARLDEPLPAFFRSMEWMHQLLAD